MSHDTNMLRAAVRKMLDKVGRVNGTACPQSNSNADSLMHDMFVAAEGQAYYKNKYEQAKQTVLDAVIDGTELSKAEKRVARNMMGESYIGATGDLYQVSIDISKPSVRLDQKKLKNTLMVKYGMSEADVNTAIAGALVPSAPAKRIKVMGK